MSASECKTRAPQDMIMMSLFCYLKKNWGDTHTTTLVTTHSPSAPFAEALEVLNLGEENGQRTHMFTHDAETRHHEDATPPGDTNTVPHPASASSTS